MGSQAVDLVYELQGELNWDKKFASSACKEYSRWLQLRASTGDFEACKLPPSRVVAMVWSLHRQWTLDYEKTCTSLGGFIHHYPPAMRMGFAREQCYAVTLQTYKSHFKEHPPPSYWEPPICVSRPNLDIPTLLTQATETPTAQAHLTTYEAQLSGAAAEHGALRKDTPTSADPKDVAFLKTRRRCASSPRQSPTFLDGQGVDQRERGSPDIPSDRTGYSTVVEPLSLAQGVMVTNDFTSTQRAHGQRNKNSTEASIKDTGDKESKLKSSHRGGRNFHEVYVLRPLAPGEKRGRGRPSLSEYMPISELADDHENVRETLTVRGEKDGDGKLVDDPFPPRSKRARRTLKLQRPIIARPPREASRHRPESSRSFKQDAPLKEGARTRRQGGHSETDKTTGMTSKQQTAVTVRIGPDGIPLRRPRGRPRKDGSWPIPRAKRQQVPQSALTAGTAHISPVGNPPRRPRGRPRKDGSWAISRTKRQQVSQLAFVRQDQPRVPIVSQSEEPTAGKQEEYLSTSLMPNTGSEQGDVPLPSLEGEAGRQTLDTTEPDSNEAQIRETVSEKGTRV